MNTIDIMDRGMRCLLENLGTIETERFIAVLIRERFDYTKWRQTVLDNISVPISLFILSVWRACPPS